MTTVLISSGRSSPSCPLLLLPRDGHSSPSSPTLLPSSLYRVRDMNPPRSLVIAVLAFLLPLTAASSFGNISLASIDYMCANHSYNLYARADLTASSSFAFGGEHPLPRFAIPFLTSRDQTLTRPRASSLHLGYLGYRLWEMYVPNYENERCNRVLTTLSPLRQPRMDTVTAGLLCVGLHTDHIDRLAGVPSDEQPHDCEFVL